MTHEQAEMLEMIKRQHPQLRRVTDESSLGSQLLARCVTDTYAFQCRGCQAVFTVEPDGETDVWALVD